MTKTVQQQPSTADELRALIAKATDDDLSEGGRYFHDSCHDLTKCGHGDTGEYQHRADGKLVEWLWNHRHDIAKSVDELDIRLARIGALEAAGGRLLEHRVGVLPNLGFIRDNDASRAAVAALAELLTPNAPEVSNG